MKAGKVLMDNYRRVFGKSTRYQNVFGNPDGDFVIGDIIRQANLLGQSYVPGSFDATAYNEGQRRIVQYIVNMIEMTPEEIRRVAELAARTDRENQELDYDYQEVSA